MGMPVVGDAVLASLPLLITLPFPSLPFPLLYTCFSPRPSSCPTLLHRQWALECQQKLSSDIYNHLK